MALYARKNNLNKFVDSYYEFIFYDPNDVMGESMPLILNINKFRTKQDILNNFRNLFGKEGRKNYFTGYQDYFYYNIFELSDLKPYMTSNQKSLFSKDCESLKSIKILGMRGYLKNEEEMRLFYLLYKSCALGIYSVVKVLKDFKGIDPNKADNNGITPLYIASQNGQTEVVKVLKEFNGIDPNKARNDSITPLFIASHNGHTEVVKALKELKGIDPNKADNYGITSLYIASQEGLPEVVKVLKEFNGIDPNKARNDGKTSLFIASQLGHSEVVKALKELKGIDPNKADNYGVTPIFSASLNGHIEVVKALIEFKGINPNKADNEGQTPLDNIDGIIQYYDILKSSGQISKPREEYEKIKDILSRLYVPIAAPRTKPL